MTANNRILVIDDDAAILTTYKLILAPREKTLADKGKSLFPGDSPPSPPTPSPDFQVDLHTDPQGGIQAAQRALADNRPFAGAFVDMNMPGLNGIQVIQALHAMDPRMVTALVTAEEHLDPDIREKHTPMVLPKPFSTQDIRRAAQEMSRQWQENNH